MWSEFNAPKMAGIITAIGPPKLGMNCSSPAKIAHTGAQGMPIIQCFSADPVVRACERQSRQSIKSVNHKGHEGAQSQKFRPECLIFCRMLWSKHCNKFPLRSFVSFVVK